MRFLRLNPSIRKPIHPPPQCARLLCWWRSSSLTSRWSRGRITGFLISWGNNLASSSRPWARIRPSSPRLGINFLSMTHGSKCSWLHYKSWFLSGLHTAKLSWQTRVGKPKLVCVNGIKTVGKHVSIWCQQFANVFAACFCAVHTHQLGFANTSLPTEVCRVKAALDSFNSWTVIGPVFACFFLAFWAKWRTYASVLRIFGNVEQDISNCWKIGLSSSNLALASVVTAPCLTVLKSAVAVSCFGEVSAFSEVFISFKNSASSARILWSSAQKLGHLASGNF